MRPQWNSAVLLLASQATGYSGYVLHDLHLAGLGLEAMVLPDVQDLG